MLQRFSCISFFNSPCIKTFQTTFFTFFARFKQFQAGFIFLLKRNQKEVKLVEIVHFFRFASQSLAVDWHGGIISCPMGVY